LTSLATSDVNNGFGQHEGQVIGLDVMEKIARFCNEHELEFVISGEDPQPNLEGYLDVYSCIRAIKSIQRRYNNPLWQRVRQLGLQQYFVVVW
jgi:hypothetical protein